jgi:hypothetical protein
MHEQASDTAAPGRRFHGDRDDVSLVELEPESAEAPEPLLILDDDVAGGAVVRELTLEGGCGPAFVECGLLDRTHSRDVCQGHAADNQLAHERIVASMQRYLAGGSIASVAKFARVFNDGRRA